MSNEILSIFESNIICALRLNSPRPFGTPLLRLRFLSNNGSLTHPLATAIALLMPASPAGRTNRARGKIMSLPQKFTQQTHPYGLPVLHPSFCSKAHNSHLVRTARFTSCRLPSCSLRTAAVGSLSPFGLASLARR
jgi:hypothetical protein